MDSFHTPDPITLEIRNAAGQVRIALTDTQSTTVEVVAAAGHSLGFIDDFLKSLGTGGGFDGFGTSTPDDQPGSSTDAGVVQHVAGDSPTVVVDTRSARDGRRSAFDVTVTAPTGSHIRLQSKSSALTVTGAAGRVDVRTASGNVQLAEVQGNALLQTASGDITVEIAAQDVDVRTASGDVRIGPTGGSALVHTASGDIRLGAVTGDITARSVSGDVQVADAASGSARINAVSGDVRIGIHTGSLAAIDLSTISGTTRTEFQVAGEAPDGDAPILQVKVRTTSGDILLHPAA